MKLLVLLALLRFSLCFTAVPLLLASHKLVPSLKDEINTDAPYDAQSLQSVTNMVKKLVTKCSSDTYMIINQPGLKTDDLIDMRRNDWKFIYKYATLASTTIGIPFVAEPLDLDYIEDYIRLTCDAESMSASYHEDEIQEYFDTRTRIIKMELPELPEDQGERFHQISKNDELLRKILRKSPSPHYTILLTSTEPIHYHPIPNFVYTSNPAKFNIFNLITNDPSRSNEVERNDRFHRPKPNFNHNKHTNNRYLENRKKDEIHFFDYELWSQNDKLLMTIFIMIVSIFLKKFFDIINSLKLKIINKKKKNGLINADSKKD